jgi:hypothetical protein
MAYLPEMQLAIHRSGQDGLDRPQAHALRAEDYPERQQRVN